MTSTQRRSPTIDDLRVKMCWICREEESQEESCGFILSCTLIAHSDCLLEWIKESQSQPSRRENALKCPQCGTRYIIISRNPFVLRWMDLMDQIANKGGKFTTLGIIAGLGASFAGSIYGLCTLYGAHAVRLYVGPQLYSSIIGDNPKEWDWATYLNLPMIPFCLIISRMRVFDGAFSTVTLPLLFSLSFPAPSTIAAANKPLGLPHFLTSYPPTPWVAVLVYPLIRTWYLGLRDRLTYWVLETRPDRQGSQDGPARRRTWVLEDNENDRLMGADVRIDLAVNVQEDPPQLPIEQIAPQNNNGEAAANQNPQQGQGHRRVRLTFSSLGRFIGTALATPWIAKYMGALLEVLSRHSPLLQRVLGIENIPAIRQGWVENIARGSGALEKLKGMGVKTSWGAWNKMDPVWWRNSLGLGLWTMFSDGVWLLHLFLRKRELESRRIMSRSFAGIDVGTLDLISPAAF